MTVLSVKGLCKEYEGFKLDNVSFELEEGRIMGFIGRNGAGKTTTLKSLLNLVHPSSGEIEFFGKRFAESEREIKGRIGYVSGAADYYTKKKISAITDVTRRFYERWDEKAYRRYMDMFSLVDSKTPEQLSAGMRVKYSLALALSHNAELLMLDEPTSGLDPVSRDDLLDVFLTLADEGKSILFSTHITSDLDKCADDITYIKTGKMAHSGPLEEFVNKYRTAALSESELTDAVRQRLIGLKRAKHGFTAIVEASDAESLGLKSEASDLESIMVHFERGEENEKSSL